jgi:hypothetical protein
VVVNVRSVDVAKFPEASDDDTLKWYNVPGVSPERTIVCGEVTEAADVEAEPYDVVNP